MPARPLFAVIRPVKVLFADSCLIKGLKAVRIILHKARRRSLIQVESVDLVIRVALQVGIGDGKKYQIDLLVESEAACNNYGVYYGATFEV